jgi:hypothetical protein
MECSVPSDDDLIHENTDSSEPHAMLTSVNKKRSKYVHAYTTSIGGILPLLFLLCLYTARVLPTCTLVLLKTTHPAHRYTNVAFRGCITGDGPSPVGVISALNPNALAFFHPTQQCLKHNVRPHHIHRCSIIQFPRQSVTQSVCRNPKSHSARLFGRLSFLSLHHLPPHTSHYVLCGETLSRCSTTRPSHNSLTRLMHTP